LCSRLERCVPHLDHRFFGGLGDYQRLVDALLELAQQRRRGALGQQPVLRVVARGHLPNLRAQQAAKPPEH
jgi:hypothetical protein